MIQEKMKSIGEHTTNNVLSTDDNIHTTLDSTIDNIPLIETSSNKRKEIQPVHSPLRKKKKNI